MKNWLEARYEDVAVEIVPGVTVPNDDMISKLNWTSYLAHIGELINTDENQSEQDVREHFDTLLFLINGERIRALTGEYPTLEENQRYMQSPEARESLRYLTAVTVKLDRESWPEFRNHVCEEVGLDPEDFRFDFEKE